MIQVALQNGLKCEKQVWKHLGTFSYMYVYMWLDLQVGVDTHLITVNCKFNFEYMSSDLKVDKTHMYISIYGRIKHLKPY